MKSPENTRRRPGRVRLGVTSICLAMGLLLAACGGGGGASYTVSQGDATMLAKKALDNAKAAAGAKGKVTEDMVVLQFKNLIAEDPLRDWWKTSVGPGGVEIQFLMVDPSHLAHDPTATVAPVYDPSKPTTTTADHGGDHGEDHSADAAGHGGHEVKTTVAVAACVSKGEVGWQVRAGRCEGAEDTKSDETHKSGSHWEYSGSQGPQFWGRLSPEYAKCVDGSMQSPIDITGTTKRDAPDLGFSYAAGDVKVEDNGHTIVVNFPAGSTVTVDGVTYALVQGHYHAHSEHAIDGKFSPAEWHFVHKAADGKLAVVGFMVVPGAVNDAWMPVIKAIAAGASGQTVAGVNPAQLLPGNVMAIRYDGSLTTPPCSEGVKWNVLKGVVEMSPDQLKVLTDTYSNNARPLQPLNGRTVVEDTALTVTAPQEPAAETPNE